VVLSRRRFVAAAAAVCVGCGSDPEEATEDDPVRRRADASTTSTTTSATVPETSTSAPGREERLPGGRIDLGAADELARRVEEEVFLYFPHGRLWLVRYPPEAVAAAEAQYGSDGGSGIARGFVALYQKCPHLGCRVPECTMSGRFECPCHGSTFTRVGEWVAGPAPRGMDRFPVSIEGERVVVDTGSLIQGADQGVHTMDPEPIGPSCIGG
jgi:Rieske Fe-S protein